MESILIITQWQDTSSDYTLENTKLIRAGALLPSIVTYTIPTKLTKLLKFDYIYRGHLTARLIVSSVIIDREWP